ncbi:MAG: Rnase Y domain-containing protein, partial [Anaerolineales bacterium]
MNGIFILIPTALIALVIGLGIGYVIKQILVDKAHEKTKAAGQQLLDEAHKRAKDIELGAKNRALEIREEAETEVTRRRNELSRDEEKLHRRRDELDTRSERLERREQTLNKRQSAIDKRGNEIDKLHAQQLEELQRISHMTVDEARTALLNEVEKETRNDMARIIRQVEAEAREEGERRARYLITSAIQRVASEHVTDVTTSVVPLPSDEMKGRIIGRNGRNIHAFEQVAGVDVIVDDTPEAVTISCFDPVRREIARRSLAKLVLDGRIHPAHIEKVLKNEQKEVDRVITDAGEQAAYDAGVHGLHPEILKTLGRLKYRTSYGQNQLAHAVETSQ